MPNCRAQKALSFCSNSKLDRCVSSDEIGQKGPANPFFIQYLAELTLMPTFFIGHFDVKLYSTKSSIILPEIKLGPLYFQWGIGLKRPENPFFTQYLAEPTLMPTFFFGYFDAKL